MRKHEIKVNCSPEEDAKIIRLRGNGMKWEDISKLLPGRSATSCRLHYLNDLETEVSGTIIARIRLQSYTKRMLRNAAMTLVTRP